MANYRLSSSAAGDIEHIFEFGIDQFGLEEALDFRDRLVIRLSHIAEAPYQYPAVDDIKPGYRRSVFGSHAIYYQVLENTIVIARILERWTATWNQFCLRSVGPIRQENGEGRCGASVEPFDAAGGRRTQTQRAGPFCAMIGAVRLDRTPGMACAEQLVPDAKRPRQNGSMSPSAALGHQDPAGSL